MAFSLKSPAFEDGQRIPPKYARDGQNVSPPLEWSGAPREAKSFVVIVEDPDAPHGMFRHWAIHGVRGDHLEEGAGTRRPGQGVNDFGNIGYDGPQPPHGDGPHRYHFRIAALDSDDVAVDPDADAMEIWRAAKPHMLAETELVGVFERG